MNGAQPDFPRQAVADMVYAQPVHIHRLPIGCAGADRIQPNLVNGAAPGRRQGHPVHVHLAIRNDVPIHMPLSAPAARAAVPEELRVRAAVGCHANGQVAASAGVNRQAAGTMAVGVSPGNGNLQAVVGIFLGQGTRVLGRPSLRRGAVPVP